MTGLMYWTAFISMLETAYQAGTFLCVQCYSWKSVLFFSSYLSLVQDFFLKDEHVVRVNVLLSIVRLPVTVNLHNRPSFAGW